MINKRGQTDLVKVVAYIGAILVLLVVLLAFFGWNITDLFKKIVPTKTNADIVAQQCLTACSTNSMNDFCCLQRDVTFKDGEKAVKLTCKDDSRLKGSCSIDCSVALCGTPEIGFKTVCASKCTVAAQKDFCCGANQSVVVSGADVQTNCKSYVALASVIGANTAEKLGITDATLATACNAINCASVTC